MENQFSWQEKLEEHKLLLILGVVGGVLFIGGIVSSGIISNTFNKPVLVKSSQTSSQVSSTIAVDVSGEVVNPGVYQLKTGSRVEDAIQAAGGFSDQADPNYVSKSLNLAQKLSDGSKIYIPKSGEQSSSAVAGATSSTLVNVNLASSSQLEELPGVGPVTAQNIIGKRPYQTVDELLSKRVISKSAFTKIKDMVTVN